MTTLLDVLKQYTTVVADTGDFEQIHKYKPQDATTNPSLIYAASTNAHYRHLVDEAVSYAQSHSSDEKKRVELALDKVTVNFGLEILKLVPGRVSTEVDARLSYDTAATVAKARELTRLYSDAGVGRDRVLIKIASTWPGIQAARQLEQEGIHCNLTLLFSLVQAQACGEAGVTLISPFVGRITDFYKAKGRQFGVEDDPGVQSVRQIYAYLKTHGYRTVVMGASFRSTAQVLALAGCDLLTISPALLQELAQAPPASLHPALGPHVRSELPRVVPDHSTFETALAADEMASFKLKEGIEKFAADVIKLEEALSKQLRGG